MTSTKKIIENKADSEENLLTPRFYTTNFKEMAELDVSSNLKEIEARNKAANILLSYMNANAKATEKIMDIIYSKS